MNRGSPGPRRAAPALAVLLALSSACSGGPPPSVTPSPRSALPEIRLQHELDALLADPSLERGTWGVAVRSVERGDTLYALNSGKLLTPGSAMKVVTLAAAAERLGWDFTYETRLLAVGAIDFGFLDGDLLVVGSGDPGIEDWDGSASRLFSAWADRLKAQGVRSIGGRIIGDDNAFDDADVGLGAGWAWDDLGASYATAVGALQFNQNTVRVAIAPGALDGAPVQVTPVAGPPALSVSSALRTAPPGSAWSIQARRLPGSHVIDLRGWVPASEPLQYRNFSVDNATAYFLGALKSALVDNGIEIRGPAVDIDAIENPPPTTDGVPLVAYRSAPLADLAATMMKNSQNLYAETLLRTLGRQSGTGSAEAGRAVVRSVLEAWDVPADQVVVADGSGLSRYNLATAGALATVLAHAASDVRLGPIFEASLPLAGREGTLARRMHGTVAEGNARAKTGSLSNARALAGYVRTADGERLAFALLCNNYGIPGDAVERVMDAVVARLAEFTRHPS